MRYIVRGTQGTYIKYGLDVQEDQLKVISTPTAIHEEHYGKEPESQWGTLENIEADYITVTKSMCVFEHANILVTDLFFQLAFISSGIIRRVIQKSRCWDPT